MNKKPAVCMLAALIITALALGSPINCIAVADDSSSFFAGYSFSVTEANFPANEDAPFFREPSIAASTSTGARLLLSGLFDIADLTPGGELHVRITVDPKGQPINLVDAELAYSSSTLSLVRIDTDGSGFSMNLIENKETGKASLIAMQPFPGVSTTTAVADLVFMAVASGPAGLAFDPESAVLANDGYGTDVLGESPAIDFIIR